MGGLRVAGFSGGTGLGCECCVSTPCATGGGCNDGPAQFCTWIYIRTGVTHTVTAPTGCFSGVNHGGGIAVFDGGGCNGPLVGAGFRFDMACYTGPPAHMGLVLSADPSGASIFGTTEKSFPLTGQCTAPTASVGCVSGFSGSCSPYSMEWTGFDFTGIPGGSGSTYSGYTFISITYTD